MRKPIHRSRYSYSLIIGMIVLCSASTFAQGIITTVAGNGARGFSGDGGPAISSTLNLGEFTGGVAVDTAGNLYIADSNNNCVRKVDLSGTITTVARSLNYPSGLAFDSAENLYIVDTGNQRIRKLSPNGIINTVAGNGVAGFSGDGGPAIRASLHFNRYTGDCGVDSAGNLYIPDTENYRIRRVGIDGIITTVASVRWPYSVAVDAIGDLYVGAEDGVSGKVGAGGLNVPAGVAVDRAGNLYIADSHNHRVRKVDPNGVATIIAGSGDPIFDPVEGYYFVGGFSGDGGPATSAQLNFPWGVALDAAGNVYIADSLNNRIRKVSAANTEDHGTFTGGGILLFGPFGSDPYPSVASVSGLGGTVNKVTATITGLSPAPRADLAFLLVGPNGQSTILMSGVGVNNSDTLTLTFDDAAPSFLQSILESGTYKPSPLRPVTFPPPASAEGYGTTLSVFNGTNPNGDWKLYAINFYDDLGCGIDGENCAGVRSWILTVATTAPTDNPIDDTQFFVRQHYRDFLNREPDPDGLNFWTREIFVCGSDPQCIEVKRINDSASFFLSIEFQETGYLVYRFYKAAYGNLPDAPVPIRLSEFLPDAQQIGNGVIVKQTGWEQQLENNKQAFANDFVQRSRFTTAYPIKLSPDAFVDALCANAGVTPTSAERAAAINEFGAASTTADTVARARALRRVAENSTLAQQEFNRAFVLMQYFGYLRRSPNDAPDGNFDGYNFWLDKLNQFNGNYIQAEMVKAFLNSIEYRSRFGP